MKQYKDFLEHILENGSKKEDRTGTGTISTFGYQMRFDLSKGFPAVTTKKLFLKGVIAELLWFLEGSTDERRLAEIQYGLPREQLIGKNTIWTANADAQGKDLGYVNTDTIKHLGPIYGHVWRRTNSNTHKIIEIETTTYPEFITEEVILDKVNNEIKNDDYLGKIVKSKTGEEFIVLDKLNTPHNASYLIQCIANGYKKIVKRPNLRNGSFGIDLRYGKFFTGGKFKNDNIKYYKKAQTLWYNMTDRCYNKNSSSYEFYKDVIIHPDWYNFDNFLRDIEKLPNFYNWLNGTDDKINDWCLDKDYKATNLYSKDTCIFLQSRVNKSYANREIDFTNKKIIEFPDGTKDEFIFMKDLIAKYPEYKFNKESIRLCLLGKQTNHKKCKFYKVQAKENHVFRKEAYIDQLVDAINQIKTNPDSRRIIVNAWNVAEIDKMSLPPCHTMFQFYVQNGKLSCQLYQRSADAFLGVPYNIASYALLTMMIAQVCNLEVGEFIHTFGDAHIYLNHIDQVKEQLSRECYELPTMILNTDIKNIDNFTMNDFELSDYTCHPTIKAEMAV